MKITCVICSKVNELPHCEHGGDDCEKKLILTRIWNIFIKYFYLAPSKWEDVSSFYIEKGQLPFCYHCSNKMRQLMECHEKLECILEKVDALTSNLSALFKSSVDHLLFNNPTERKNGQQQIDRRLQDLRQNMKQRNNNRKTGLVRTFVCDENSEFVQFGDKFKCSICKIIKDNFSLMSQHVQDAHEDTPINESRKVNTTTTSNNKDKNTNSKKRKLYNTTDDYNPITPICVIKEEDSTESRPNEKSSATSSNVHLVNFTVEINRDDSEAAVVGQVETLNNNNPLECFYDESEEAQDFVQEEEKEIRNQRSQKKESQCQPLKEKDKGFFKCFFPGCRKVFGSHASCMYHENSHVISEPNFICSVCDCTFVHESNFTLHTLKYHPELAKIPKINIMSSIPSQPSNSNILMRQTMENPELIVTRGGAPFPCGSCSKSYWSETGLAIHSRAHKSSSTNNNQVQGQQNTMVDNQKNQMKVVQNTSGVKSRNLVYNPKNIQITPTTNTSQQVRSVQNSSSSSSPTAASQEKKGIKCEICLQSFPLASSLQIHLRKVHNVRVNA